MVFPLIVFDSVHFVTIIENLPKCKLHTNQTDFLDPPTPEAFNLLYSGVVLIVSEAEAFAQSLLTNVQKVFFFCERRQFATFKNA